MYPSPEEDSYEGQHKPATALCKRREGGWVETSLPNCPTGFTCFFTCPVASQKLDHIFFLLMHIIQIPMM